jgi:hypothetical protein
LRSEDIKQIDNIWCIAFAAESGSLKNMNSERVIPVHAALIDEGFLKFAASTGAGPLFPDLSEDRFGRRGGNGKKSWGDGSSRSEWPTSGLRQIILGVTASKRWAAATALRLTSLMR